MGSTILMNCFSAFRSASNFHLVSGYWHLTTTYTCVVGREVATHAPWTNTFVHTHTHTHTHTRMKKVFVCK